MRRKVCIFCTRGYQFPNQSHTSKNQSPPPFSSEVYSQCWSHAIQEIDHENEEQKPYLPPSNIIKSRPTPKTKLKVVDKIRLENQNYKAKSEKVVKMMKNASSLILKALHQEDEVIAREESIKKNLRRKERQQIKQNVVDTLKFRSFSRLITAVKPPPSLRKQSFDTEKTLLHSQSPAPRKHTSSAVFSYQLSNDSEQPFQDAHLSTNTNIRSDSLQSHEYLK